MKKSIFTIFTPTYNRAHTLPRLYESLISQNFQDFEWLIVDDGSTDETKNLVESFKKENRLNINYISQQNGGKHIAINTGLEYAKGEWFWTLDSDDYLRENALQKSIKIIENLSPDFAGFTVIRFTDDVVFDGNSFGKKTWQKDGEYQWPYPGEMTFVWKTEVAKQYPFPVFPGEKFCQESLVLRRILMNQKALFTDHVLIGGDYLEDGLSQNIWERMKTSPHYSLLNYAERISQKAYKTEQEKWDFVKKYWDIALFARHIPWVEKLRGMPMALTIQFFMSKILKKL